MTNINETPTTGNSIGPEASVVGSSATAPPDLCSPSRPVATDSGPCKTAEAESPISFLSELDRADAGGGAPARVGALPGEGFTFICYRCSSGLAGFAEYCALQHTAPGGLCTAYLFRSPEAGGNVSCACPVRFGDDGQLRGAGCKLCGGALPSGRSECRHCSEDGDAPCICVATTALNDPSASTATKLFAPSSLTPSSADSPADSSAPSPTNSERVPAMQASRDSSSDPRVSFRNFDLGYHGCAAEVMAVIAVRGSIDLLAMLTLLSGYTSGWSKDRRIATALVAGKAAEIDGLRSDREAVLSRWREALRDSDRIVVIDGGEPVRLDALHEASISDPKVRARYVEAMERLCSGDTSRVRGVCPECKDVHCPGCVHPRNSDPHADDTLADVMEVRVG